MGRPFTVLQDDNKVCHDREIEQGILEYLSSDMADCEQSFSDDGH
jgi:hypothetical protein